VSRGPGKWERLILHELSEREYFYLADLLPPDHRKAEYNALNRAAGRLCVKGLIGILDYAYGTAKVLCMRVGAPRPPGRPDRARRLD
jgi:hypothetical protein